MAEQRSGLTVQRRKARTGLSGPTLAGVTSGRLKKGVLIEAHRLGRGGKNQSTFPPLGYSSIGRVAVSKTVGCGFESHYPCLAPVDRSQKSPGHLRPPRRLSTIAQREGICGNKTSGEDVPGSLGQKPARLAHVTGT